MTRDGRTLNHGTLETIRTMAVERVREGEGERPATGRPRTLTARQERQVFHWIKGKNPRQYGFDFGLWTRQIVCKLIAQRFGVRLSLASIGAVLAR